MSITIYMFHAIGGGDAQDWADPHYSYKQSLFEIFLDKAGSVFSLETVIKNNLSDAVVVTFDDGHISNYQAAKYIHNNGYGSADFFINPDKVGQEYYMTWGQVKEIAELGMSIQSHGLNHQYLSDCSDTELHRQLSKSKQDIEKKIGQKVSVIAPPGGRYDDRTVRIAKELGYRYLTSSEPGNMNKLNGFICPRIAVMEGNSPDYLLSATKRVNKLILKQKTKYLILYFIKKLLGNERYEKFRWQVVGTEK